MQVDNKNFGGIFMNITRRGGEFKPCEWARYKYNLTTNLGENGQRLTGSKEHIAISKKAADEGMVLLENNGILPLKKGTAVALFGVGSIDYINGGGGSGAVFSEYVRNIYEGFVCKTPDYSIYEPLSKFYYEYCLANMRCDKGVTMWDLLLEEPELSADLIDDAAKNSDVAIITIHHFASEATDRLTFREDFYLSDAEKKLINDVTAKFEHSVVVFDTCGILDVSFLKSNPKIDALLLAWKGGMEGGLTIADILTGEVNPSGKLTDTIARDVSDYPCDYTFKENDDYVNYHEDIYVGYRYFETVPGASDKVIYPFGYGLSYTEFSISKPVASLIGDKIRVETTVKNIGKVAGKEVVQCYFSAPQGVLGKSKIALIGFKKTTLLAPGQSEDIVIEFSISDMASYDDLGKLQESAYLLEKGEYIFYIGNSCRNLTEADYRYEVKDDFVVTRQLTRRCAPNLLDKRMLSDGSFEGVPSFEIKEHDIAPAENNTPPLESEYPYHLHEIRKGKITLDQFLTQFTDDELITIVGGSPHCGVSNTAGMGGIKRLGVPAIMTADGPAGLRLDPCTGIATTCFPCASLVACTWNPELAFEIGRAGGLECKENALGIWLTPALNIHRHPLCGRNFEYFSEDPLISGEFAAAQVNGIQSVGIAASAKHLAANNKEVNRHQSDSRVSERALREIYLKGFEICVKKSQPYTVMTAYNILNGVRCCESYELQSILRDEWGFEGMITTDWGVICDHSKVVKAGNDIRMDQGIKEDLYKALENGTMKRGHLEACARRILEMILKLD